MADSKDAEKAYLARTGSSEWERAKPFSPPGSDTLAESARLLHDFSVALLALDPAPSDRILDLGAGGCWCSDMLGRLNRSSVAVDIAVDMLRAGKSRPTGGAIRAVAGDLERLPFQSGSFDKAICLNAIHHVPDIPAALRELARVLADDGSAFFSEPGRGHAQAAVSAAAMHDFGVLEQDILVEEFARWCADAGFHDVRVLPMSYALPEFDLDVEHFAAWSRLARSKRPARALGTIGRGLLELAGGGKKSSLLEETMAMSLARIVQGAVEHHPMLLVSKQARTIRVAPAWSARIVARGIAATATARGTVHVRLVITNLGRAWQASSDSGIAHVRLGVQLLDADQRLLNRDHHRVTLPRPVGTGETVSLAFDCPLPETAGRYHLKFDLVAEGVTWFEQAGSRALVHELDVS